MNEEATAMFYCSIPPTDSACSGDIWAEPRAAALLEVAAWVLEGFGSCS